jgi:ATP-dependent RNA helicase SUPV3L1/SUV3
LWTRTHIERLLAPLFVLGAAEDVTGLARGIAFQVVEALGVLERSKVAEDVKSLDQTARAILRKHGVRFGAFHIYVPGLLKPGPRALAAELWALKHGGPEVKGLDEVQRLASSGRTSFPADKETPKALYRATGYRVCGERAVRVDILERLADLIRPALAWRETMSEKPAGAVDGRSFTVTQAMTSLTGSSGEDFASILRALGYRMERRPKPAEVPAPAPDVAAPSSDVAPAPDGESAPADVAAADGIETTLAPEADVNAEPVAATPLPQEPALAEAPASAALSEESAPFVAEARAEEAAAAPDAGAAPESGAAASEPVAQSADVAAAPAPADQAAAPAPEPQFIEVWRPGGRSDERRGPRRHARPQRPHQGQPAEAGAAPEQAADGSAPAPADSENRGRRRGRRGRPDTPAGAPRPERQEGPGRQDRQDRQERHARPERNDRPRGPRGERPDRKDQRPDRRPNRGGEPRVFASSEQPARERRTREPDPNSPFAKLAALKAQLEANEKEKR